MRKILQVLFQGISILTILFISSSLLSASSYAWTSTQTATPTCAPSTSQVNLNLQFTNTEAANTRSMDVIATDTQTGIAQNLGSVTGQKTTTSTINTKQPSIKNGSVAFNLTWTDGSPGIDTKMADYATQDCSNSGGGTITPAPTGTTPAPSSTPGSGKNSIAGSIYVDADNNGKYATPPDILYSATTTNVTITDSTGKAIQVPVTNGTYTSGATLPPGTYTVSYTAPTTVYTLSYPQNPASFSVSIGNTCMTQGNDSSCDTGGNVTNLNFGLSYGEGWLCTSCITGTPSATTTTPPAGTTTPGVTNPVAMTNTTSAFAQICPNNPTQICINGQVFRIHSATAYHEYNNVATEIAHAQALKLNTLEMSVYDSLDQVDNYVQAAKAVGMHIIINLSVFGQQNNNSLDINTWKPYLDTIASKYGNDPTVLMIELFGEPPDSDQAKGFFAAATDYLRNVKQVKNLVSTGGIGDIDFSSPLQNDWHAIMDDPNNQVCAVEVNSSGEETISAPEVRDYCNGKGKPWFLAAWSACSGGGGGYDDQGSESAANDHAIAMYNLAKTAIGTSFWNLSTDQAETCSPNDPSWGGNPNPLFFQTVVNNAP